MYAGRNQKPSHLIDSMLYFGIDLLTMKPLSSKQMRDMQDAGTVH